MSQKYSLRGHFSQMGGLLCQPQEFDPHSYARPVPSGTTMCLITFWNMPSPLLPLLISREGPWAAAPFEKSGAKCLLDRALSVVPFLFPLPGSRGGSGGIRAKWGRWVEAIPCVPGSEESDEQMKPLGLGVHCHHQRVTAGFPEPAGQHCLPALAPFPGISPQGKAAIALGSFERTVLCWPSCMSLYS